MNLPLSGFAAAFLMLATAIQSEAGETRYRFDEGSTVTYHPSPESPGVSGCMPDSYSCTFEIAGEFTLATPSESPFSYITDVEIDLSGNESSIFPSGAIEPGVVAWLESIALNVAIAQNSVLPPPPPTFFYFWRAPNAGRFLSSFWISTPPFRSSASISGGYDNRDVDLDAILFDAAATVIPEPSAALLTLIGVASSAGLRRRLAVTR